uniref:Selenoprotein J n=1 Tax=Lepisosteus oculatus TaxID=7918 RepID=W5MML3_LEPOC
MALTLEDRILGAIIGAAVADAAAQPLHWIYDLKMLHTILSNEPCPEFRPQSANPFYRRETGQQSCYGDQAFVLLESLTECGGLNVDDLKQRTYKFFGPGSEYDTPGPRPQLPIEGPWRHASLKSFLKNFEAGKTDTGCEVDNQIDGIAKLAPIVALYAGKPELLEKVKVAICVTQNSDTCVAVTLAAARFLEYYILHGPDQRALDVVLDQLKNQNSMNPQNLDGPVYGWWINFVMFDTCFRDHSERLPGAFQAALHGVLTETVFEQAIRNTMSCGGCTSSRSSFIGACLGAQVGLSGIPDSWKIRTLRYPILLELAKKVAQLHE